jgi:hypothetical protein
LEDVVLVFNDEDFLGERACHGRCREPTRAYELCQARGRKEKRGPIQLTRPAALT